jgi:tetratricopeptide (TPR) repeat protein
VWQALRAELHDRGLEVVTVALDTGGADAVRPHVEAAGAEHPSLIDEAHRLDELLGVVNVPTGIWIDEEGTIVRGPETAYPGGGYEPPKEPPADATPQMREAIDVLSRLQVPKGYADAIRDWVANGVESRFALSPEQVVSRSKPRSRDAAEAAAAFELGQHLHRAGHADDAIGWFRRAQELQPDNWTYNRQAWNLLGRERKSTDVYGTDWMTEVKKIGPENYYDAVPEMSD